MSTLFLILLPFSHACLHPKPLLTAVSGLGPTEPGFGDRGLQAFIVWLYLSRQRMAKVLPR